MKRQKYFEVIRHRDADGNISYFLDEQRAEIIQMPSGYRYALRFMKERKAWTAVDLITGLIIQTRKTNPDMQLWMVENEQRVRDALENLFYSGKDQKIVKQHELIVAELSKDDETDIAPEIKAYIISKGFRQ